MLLCVPLLVLCFSVFHFYELSLNWYGYFVHGLQVDHTARRASDLGVSGLPGLPLLP